MISVEQIREWKREDNFKVNYLKRWGVVAENPQWAVIGIAVDGKDIDNPDLPYGGNGTITVDLAEYIVYRGLLLKAGEVPKFMREHDIKITIYDNTKDDVFYLLWDKHKWTST